MTENGRSERSSTRNWSRLAFGGLAVSVIAIAATLTTGAVLRGWSQNRHGTLLIDSDPATIGEVLDEAGNEVLWRQSLPQQDPLSLPAGRYQLRTGTRGELTTTSHIEIARQRLLRLNVDLPDTRMWLLPHASDHTLWLPTSNGHDLLSIHPHHISRLDGRTSSAVWTWSRFEEGDLDAESNFRNPFHETQRYWRATEPLDVNGDSQADVILASNKRAYVVAFDGATGTQLWEQDFDLPLRFGAPSPIDHAVVRDPLPIADLDDDGVDDLLLVIANGFNQLSFPQRMLNAISARTGDSLWKKELPHDLCKSALPMQWYCDASFFDHGQTESANFQRLYRPHDTRRLDMRASRKARTTRPGLPGQPHRLPNGQVMVACGSSLLKIDAASGMIAATVDVRGRHWMPIQVRNVDTDPAPEVICVTNNSPHSIGHHRNTVKQSRPTSAYEISVWSVAENAPLWRQSLSSWLPEPMLPGVLQAEWPLVEDIDGDGRAELVLPTRSPSFHGAAQAWGELSVLNGASGSVRWTRRIFTKDQQTDFLAVGPDVDGDGQREVYVAALAGDPLELYVDCLSGQDGEPVWRTSHHLQRYAAARSDYVIRPLTWWGCGRDGWPQLIVPLAEGATISSDFVLFSAGTGAVSHVGRQVRALSSIDTDGDGYDELLTHGADGIMSCLRGGLVHRWQSSHDGSFLQDPHHGQASPLAGDFDGDGFSDLVHVNRDGRLQAISSYSGQPIWTQRSGEDFSAATCLVRAIGDIDADGCDDALLEFFSDELRAISGAHGGVLWRQSPVYAGDVSIDDLDGDRQLEAIVFGPTAVLAAERRLYVYSGLTGRERFRMNLKSLGYRISASSTALVVGPDGQKKDIYAVTMNEQNNITLDLLRVDGRTGDVRWRKSLANAHLINNPFQESLFSMQVIDWDHDGSLEIVVTHEQAKQGLGGRTCVVEIIDSRDGKVVLSFEQDNGQGQPQVIRLPENEVQLVWPYATAAGEPVISNGNDCRQVLDLSDDPFGTDDDKHLIYVCDVDGDGLDELIIQHRSGISLREPRNADDDAIWHFACDATPGGNNVVHVRSAAGPDPAEVTVVLGSENRLLSLDPTTGELLAQTRQLGAQLIPDHQTGRLPLAINHTRSHTTRVTQAVPSDLARIDEVRAAPTLTVGRDPRAARPLPWRATFAEFGSDRRRPAIWLVGLFGLCLLMGPALYVGWVSTRRRWSLRTLLIAPAVVGGIAFALTIELHNTFDLADRFEIAVIGLPVAAFLLLIGCLCYYRLWRMLLFVLAVSATMCMVVAGVWIQRDIGTAMQAGEYYVWTGWQGALGFGPYLTGCIVAVIAPCVFVIRRTVQIVRHWRGRRAERAAR